MTSKVYPHQPTASKRLEAALEHSQKCLERFDVCLALWNDGHRSIAARHSIAAAMDAILASDEECRLAWEEFKQSRILSMY